MIPIALDSSVLFTGAGVALVFIGTVLTFLLRWQRQKKGETSEILASVKELVGALTNGKGKASISCGADPETVKRHEQHFVAITGSLADHSKLHQKQLTSINRLDQGQKEILDHITSEGKGNTQPAKQKISQSAVAVSKVIEIPSTE